MTKLKLSDTSKALVFLMVLSSDKSTGATGLSPTVTLSKNGGSFNACTGTVTEIANGWYKLVPSAADVGTLGPLALHATGTAAEPKDKEYQVVAYDPYSSTDGGLSYITDSRSTMINATSVTDQSAFVGATTTLFQFSSSSLPTSAANGGLKGKIFSIISGTGAGQDRVIINASFGVYFTLTMDAAFTVTPDATSVWIIRRDRLAKLDSSLRPSVLDSNAAAFDATAIGGDIAITLGPTTTASAGESRVVSSIGSKLNLLHAQHSRYVYAFIIVDSAGDPINLSGKSLSFVVSEPDDTIAFQLASGTGISVSGTDNNVVSVTVDTDDADTAGKFEYDLWNDTDLVLLQYGAFTIKRAVRPA